MKKTKTFYCVKFSQEAIQKTLQKIETWVDEKNGKKTTSTFLMRVTLNHETWEHDSEAEFFCDYNKNIENAIFQKRFGDGFEIVIHFFNPNSNISITALERSKIEEIHQIFENYTPQCILPQSTKPAKQEPIIFIGHGRSEQWRDLKDHLKEKHSYEIAAYEIGARAGHGIRDILEDMLEKSSFAILVMTGEDKDQSGNFHPRDNVIHELGLFQGKLGFARAIVLLEEGAKEFSNIHGIHQIRYSTGKIIETFGDILATLKREFDK